MCQARDQGISRTASLTLGEDLDAVSINVEEAGDSTPQKNALWGWTPHQKSAKAKVGPQDGVCRQLSLLRPKFVHALTSGIQAVMDDQALRRAFFLLLNLSHADVVVAVIKDDKPGNDTEYSPEESL
jgi:hypothetical protein